MKSVLRPLALCAVLIAPPALAPSLWAQSTTNDKIELMAEALRARSSGDLQTAKARLERLLQLAPNDSNVQRLLASVNQEIEREQRGLENRYAATTPPPAAPTPAPSRTSMSEVDRLVAAEASRSAPPSAPLAATVEEAPVPAEVTTDPAYAASQRALEEMLQRGRAQYIAGDYEGAQETFSNVEARDPNNAEAKYFQAVIAEALRRSGELNRYKTKEQMLQEVTMGWQRPQIFDREFNSQVETRDDGLREKLESIVLPRVSFNGIPLSRVVDTLSALSAEYDPAGVGANIVLIDPGGVDPAVNITLRGLSLARILDFTVESVGYEYDVQSDAVVVRQGQGTGTRLETEFFPISRSTIIRLTGIGSARGSGGSSNYNDPFAAPAETTSSAGGGSQSDEEESLRNFLQRAGVPFETVEGANLALADGQLIVTQTPRNMEKVRNILRRYTEVKQVEIEARFLEVRQGDLEELGFDWTVNLGGKQTFNPDTGMPIIGSDGEPVMQYSQTYSNSPSRTLAGAFGINAAQNALTINTPAVTTETGSTPAVNRSIGVGAPGIPNSLDLGAEVGNALANIAGVIGNAQVGLLIRALERQTGNDLMSAPKVTVLSGKTAEITVAQELLYPQSYGDIEAQVGRGESSGGGSAGVAITAGTPQDFTVRNVGVEMEVTPTVEEDNSISLLLEPRVTEFEGFVEYGGTSVAIASNTTVTVPSGFFQPIFSVRRVRTEVTIWDGATVVMGGLTREQAVSVSDKVPVLGDIPLLGRLFRSEGESSEKRNLLIFVTANLISPGGSPQRQQFRTVDPGSLFQNPAMVTPGGAVSRGTEDE
jgi:general secretion pathway protein D